MKIYTKTGDAGQTGLLGGRRVSKADVRIEAYGTVDELNCWIGQTRGYGPEPPMDALLERIQAELFAIGAELASPTGVPAVRLETVQAAHIVDLESAIDQAESSLPKLTQFILPGGCPLAASLHICRAVCRRAERRVVQLMELNHETVSLDIVIYLNRLSDLFFVLARVANHAAGLVDPVWSPQPPRP